MYQFETDLIRLSENGLHLLRSGYNFKTIDYLSIKEIKIEKGRQVSNWLLAMLFGLTLVGIGLFTGYKVIYEYFFADNFHLFYTQQFVFPVLPLIGGSYLIFVSSKIGLVLKVTTNQQVKRFPIETLNKQNKIDQLIIFLNTNDLTKDKFTSV